MFINTIHKILLVLPIAALSMVGCTRNDASVSGVPETPVVVASSFAYPVGDNESATQLRDAGDDWYNALDFGNENHLGEDWNKNSGGNTDCGEPVYSIGNGLITNADDAGPGWGNVVIVTHTLSDGTEFSRYMAT